MRSLEFDPHAFDDLAWWIDFLMELQWLHPAVRESLGQYKQWKHAGGKLLVEGSESLSDAELLSILIGTGVKGKTAEKIGEEIISRFNSFKDLASPCKNLSSSLG